MFFGHILYIMLYTQLEHQKPHRLHLVQIYFNVPHYTASHNITLVPRLIYLLPKNKL